MVPLQTGGPTSASMYGDSLLSKASYRGLILQGLISRLTRTGASDGTKLVMAPLQEGASYLSKHAHRPHACQWVQGLLGDPGRKLGSCRSRSVAILAVAAEALLAVDVDAWEAVADGSNQGYLSCLYLRDEGSRVEDL
jgi:hypothetical protein